VKLAELSCRKLPPIDIAASLATEIEQPELKKVVVLR
jgi:hypothetical protein